MSRSLFPQADFNRDALRVERELSVPERVGVWCVRVSLLCVVFSVAFCSVQYAGVGIILRLSERSSVPGPLFDMFGRGPSYAFLDHMSTPPLEGTSESNSLSKQKTKKRTPLTH